MSQNMSRAPILLLAAGVACAGPLFVGTLSGPGAGTASDGFGSASVSVSNDQLSMAVNVFFGGLQGAATSVFLFAGGLFPLLLPDPADTSGSVNGTFSIDAGVVTALLGGSGLVQVASTAFPEGEIAGLLRLSNPLGGGRPPPSSEVPEPGTLTLVILGLALGERGSRVFRMRPPLGVS